ncbi:MAG TPA: helix-turn-helix domain-containing protein [Jatrophihabitantaceae bacterium]
MKDAPVKLTDPKAIRALAHPARLAVIEELYAGRELTATECAEVAGLSPSAMSYHLRSLERAGIVERAEPTGDGRERPWRAAGTYLQVESESGMAESAALSAVLLSRLSAQIAQWDARKSAEPKQWRDATIMGSGQVWLRLDELKEIGAVMEKLTNAYRDRRGDDRPEDARRVRFSIFAFPTDEPGK